MNDFKVDREYVEIYPINWTEINHDFVQKMFRTRSFDKLKEISFYIHIPFCPVICPFCTFNKRLFNKKLYIRYIEALKKEILMFKSHPDFEDRKVTAIYFGGGTGSMLIPEDTQDILFLLYDNFPISSKAEITMECYPTTIDHDKLLKYKEMGVNRISIGTQSFDKENLRNIGRINTYSVNKTVIQEAKEIGFEKITVDLMYRFPNQTIDDLLMKDLEILIEINVDGISSYSLEVEATPLEKKLSEMPSDEIDKKMFYLVGEFLEQHGYRRFAQPDFAKPGKECRYVLNAWKAPQQLLLGFGAGAHTHYFGGYMWANIYPVEKYIEIVSKGYFPGVLGTYVSDDELMHKYIVLGVRCLEVDKNIFEKMFGASIEDYFYLQIKDLVDFGWIEEKSDRYVVTKEGLWYIDNISKKFYSKYNMGEKQPWGKNLYNFVPLNFYKSKEGGDKNEV